MALSPNYGWSEPDNSSLVKNGAADIRTLGDAIDTSVWNVGFGQAGKNRLINGNLDIWQRGTSITASTNGQYMADRWQAGGIYGNSVWSQQTTGVPDGSRYCMRVNSSATGNLMPAQQIVETNNTSQLWGRTVTFSVKVRRNSTFGNSLVVSVEKSATVDASQASTWTNIASATVANASLPTGTTSADWVTATVTAAIPADGTANSIKVMIAPNTTVALNGYFEFTQAQLEVGSKATPFTRNASTLALELAACQRYYFRSTSGNAYAFMPAQGVGYNATTVDLVGRMPVTMRVAPTSVDFSTLRCYDDANALPVTNLIISSNQPDATYITATVASGGVQFRPYFLGANNSSTAYLGYSAEL